MDKYEVCMLVVVVMMLTTMMMTHPFKLQNRTGKIEF